MTQIPSDPQYDKLQDTLIEVIGQPMWNTTLALSTPPDDIPNAMYHVQEAFRNLQADLEGEVSHLSDLALHTHQVLSYHLEPVTTPIFDIFDTMCHTRQLLSKPRQPTDKLTLQYVVSQHVLTLWVHQQRLIEPFLNHMLTVQQGILQGENFAPTSRQHQLAHQLWLNMVAVSAFHMAIQHMSYRADLPWAWQEPDLTHHFFEQCHAVDSRALFDIAHRLLGVSKR